MADGFNPINTQEEFDTRVTELYGDVKGLQQTITTLTGERDTHAATIADLQKQIKGHETAALKQRIAREKGIPFEMADRLSGETEKDIRSDADVVAGILRTVKGPAPLADHQQPTEDGNRAGLRNLLRKVKGE